MAQVPQVLGQKRHFYTVSILVCQLFNIMEEEHTKEPSHNNPEEAANYMKAVNTLINAFVKDIRGLNPPAHQDAYKNFLHTLSQLLSKLDSAYFTNMDIEVYLTPYQTRSVPLSLNALKKQ